MPKTAVLFVVAVALCSVAGACARKPDEAKPVATPSVTVSRSDVPVGSPVDIAYRFAVAPDAPPLDEDYLVFVHFLDLDGERMWTDDHQPPTPTGQWQPGQTIEYTRTIFIPKFPYTGTTRVEVGLYSPKSGDRLPLAGQDSGMRAYQVASFTLTREAENVFVIFKDGWYQPEVGDESGLEWQWSKQEGTLAFRNPNTDAELFLQLDQAANAFPEPQRVEVRVGDQVVDRFALPAGMRELRRIYLPQHLLGSAETVEVAVAVDKTFVPADVPGLRSSDARELGVRLFRAYVQPK